MTGWTDAFRRALGRPQRGPQTNRPIDVVAQELSDARAELTRAWPTEEPQFNLDRAPSEYARQTLQRVIRLQNELDSLGD